MYSIRCRSAISMASCTVASRSTFRNSSLNRLSNDSTNGFSQYEPGGSHPRCKRFQYTLLHGIGNEIRAVVQPLVDGGWVWLEQLLNCCDLLNIPAAPLDSNRQADSPVLIEHFKELKGYCRLRISEHLRGSGRSHIRNKAKL